ncbi:tRNA (cytosine(38)-C(5))-methyltransferase isoform X3 [Pteropus medius]|nr:tRNA (cytosine(38)-C(5))-methyltransferase isoform X3 [Pteropus vampyrus]XP_023388874.1 tRNA (cytosine(38)-C(5))-methyltransferase isoform X3 [Pteropus vampyrus]XP_023388875.1 tRNA (cytosine(38)-C(5))-methyltransferase isoform X3 [Pteropus vampyrus]XP_023388876.1 tRNA (cytosine(38)-C(5))-methyltransferase isoform X3 [Pteropus vampyrus]XP_023388878.1 tRNA (cytosine(38)-C(5))-methyltransferase isoform X3 [Pteropus vampyrus]XP_039733421.1 tRNA (cytosine(38)-C(5))-methyltransferase isoform X3 [
MILMSPPCQPFTRIGLQGDVTDPRTNSFIYILDILPRLQKLPKFILLENVKGFEISSTRDLLIQTIESCGFQYQEFLLSPTSLGIPNSRLRYFLVAKLQSEPLPFQAPGQVLMEFPKIECEHTQKRAVDAENTIEGKKIEPNVSFDSSKQCSGKEAILFKLETAGEIERKHQQDSDLSVQMLKDFLEDDADTSQYFLPPKPLLRYALLLDIVKPTCRRSMCFTKGYGRYIEGTGSVLQTAEDVQIENIYKSLTSLSQEEKIKKLLMLKLRYFTPKEIANLHGFPPEFGFPETVTMKQRYRLLGNSLNVHIVAKLIKILCE